jgi:hypothetical protein
MLVVQLSLTTEASTIFRLNGSGAVTSKQIHISAPYILVNQLITKALSSLESQ